MSRQQSGFTLVELIIVIVILGALAVVALPRFVDLQDEADQAALDGVAGSLSSAFATNYAASLVKQDSTTFGNEPGSGEYVEVTDGDPGATSASYDDSLQVGTPLTDANISITGGCDVSSVSVGQSLSCNIASEDGNTATFSVIKAD